MSCFRLVIFSSLVIKPKWRRKRLFAFSFFGRYLDMKHFLYQVGGEFGIVYARYTSLNIVFDPREIPANIPPGLTN